MARAHRLPQGLVIWPAKGPAHAAAVKATYEPICADADNVTHVVSMIRYIMGGNKRWVKCIGKAAEGNDAYEGIYTLAKRVAMCRPAGGTVRSVTEDPRTGRAKRIGTCKNHKLCPWCHYRRFKRLYDQFVALEGDHTARLYRTLLPSGTGFGHRLASRVGQWVRRGKVRAAAVVIRTDMAKSFDTLSRSDGPKVYGYVGVLIVGGDPKLKLPPVPGSEWMPMKTARSVQKAADDLLPRLYPYQAAILNDARVYSNLDYLVLKHLGRYSVDFVTRSQSYRDLRLFGLPRDDGSAMKQDDGDTELP